eukprot:scaffold308412_cov34-Prasinocladus_malaysianus.AAC.1
MCGSPVVREVPAQPGVNVGTGAARERVRKAREGLHLRLAVVLQANSEQQRRPAFKAKLKSLPLRTIAFACAKLSDHRRRAISIAQQSCQAVSKTR